jgi:Fic family protein
MGGYYTESPLWHEKIGDIHPFRDGNGRIGRLWQTLVLSKWNPLFAWTPIETLVHFNQALYYKALQESHTGTVDCKPFIDRMLDMIENSMYRYIDVATETAGVADVGINVGIKFAIMDKLKKFPTMTAKELSAQLKYSQRTIERHIAELKANGKLPRVGPNKDGHWEVIDNN